MTRIANFEQDELFSSTVIHCILKQRWEQQGRKFYLGMFFVFVLLLAGLVLISSWRAMPTWLSILLNTIVFLCNTIFLTFEVI